MHNFKKQAYAAACLSLLVTGLYTGDRTTAAFNRNNKQQQHRHIYRQ
jgi:hypothetical protein